MSTAAKEKTEKKNVAKGFQPLGDRVFVTYEGHVQAGKPFRNTELLTIRGGKLLEAEVYFGWSLPHEAPAGGFINPDR